uniref:YhcH/YjgK/YiaL family protein n=1 Tax=Klebsiella aerogenes TaxID=548 RepID=UPI0019533227
GYSCSSIALAMGSGYYNHFTYTTALISQASLFEAHERYLDLHIVLSGCEQVALAPVESLDLE